MRALKVVSAALMAVCLAACASTIAPRPELVAAGVSAPVVQGKATLVMSSTEVNQVLTPHPTSFTGSATTINIPMGQIVRVIGEKILGAGFSGGATTGEAVAPGAYAVKVEVANFSYAYDQASNLGFAITPKVTVQMTADVQSPGGKALVHKTYSKADVTPGKYAISGAPAEKINEGLHMALGQMFRELLDDIGLASK